MTNDLVAISKGDEGLDSLIELLRRDRPALQVEPEDLDGTLTSAFYVVLYMLTRASGAKDWQTGETIRHGMLGKANSMEGHHIFPKDVLGKEKVASQRINNLANFAFQTSLTNESIGKDDPADYLPKIADSQPGALESQWIPMEQSKWQVANFEDFLKARRKNLAEAANAFLDSLHKGDLPDDSVGYAPESSPGVFTMGASGFEFENERADLVAEFEKDAPGIIDHPIEVLGGNSVHLDVAWPHGLQFGLSEPVAFLFDPDEDIIQKASQAGYMVFIDKEQLREYVRAMDEGYPE
jgi:hypothetical protein